MVILLYQNRKKKFFLLKVCILHITIMYQFCRTIKTVDKIRKKSRYGLVGLGCGESRQIMLMIALFIVAMLMVSMQKKSTKM